MSQTCFAVLDKDEIELRSFPTLIPKVVSPVSASKPISTAQEIKPRASYTLGKGSIPELYVQTKEILFLLLES